MSLNGVTLKVFLLFMCCLNQSQYVQFSEEQIKKIFDTKSSRVSNALTELSKKGFIAKLPYKGASIWMVNPQCVVNGKIEHERIRNTKFNEIAKDTARDGFCSVEPKWQITKKSIQINKDEKIICSEVLPLE